MIKNIIGIILPFLDNYTSNKKIRKKMNESNGQLSDIGNSDAISLDVLKNQYLDTLHTKDKLEDKAKSNIIAVTISITLIMGASNLLNTIYSKFPYIGLYWSSVIMFVAAVLYMIIAGILSIRVLVNENIIYTVRLKSYALSQSELRNDYDICTVMNKAQNLIRNNGVYTSYECIRNALVCLFIILVMAVFPYSTKQNVTPPSLSSVNGYKIVYSSDAIKHIVINNNQAIVEATVVDAINSNKINDSKITGLINTSEKIFIKVQLNNQTLTVLVIEDFK